MLYTTFGRTGETVSRLGFGGMRFESSTDLDAMAEVVVHAHERGVTYFDTAPIYCDDRSEEIFGLALKEMRKSGKPHYITSKTMMAKPDDVRAQCERSLERLGVDAIDFYHVWCLVQPEDLPARKAEGVLDAFRKLKEEGLIRHISVSTHLEHDKVAAMLDQGEGLFEGMLIGLNALNYFLRYPGARAAHERGIPCFCADLTVNPILVDWNKNVAARLAPFPGLESGLLETNGHQNYRNWDRMVSYHPRAGASWMNPSGGVFALDGDFYTSSGGIFMPSEHYEAMFRR